MGAERQLPPGRLPIDPAIGAKLAQRVVARNYELQTLPSERLVGQAMDVLGADLQEISHTFDAVLKLEEGYERLRNISSAQTIERAYRMKMGKALGSTDATGRLKVIGHSFMIPRDSDSQYEPNRYLVVLNDGKKKRVLAVESGNPVLSFGNAKRVSMIAGDDPIDSFAEEYGKRFFMKVTHTSSNPDDIGYLDLLAQQAQTMMQHAEEKVRQDKITRTVTQFRDEIIAYDASQAEQARLRDMWGGEPPSFP